MIWFVVCVSSCKLQAQRRNGATANGRWKVPVNAGMLGEASRSAVVPVIDDIATYMTARAPRAAAYMYVVPVMTCSRVPLGPEKSSS